MGDLIKEIKAQVNIKPCKLRIRRDDLNKLAQEFKNNFAKNNKLKNDKIGATSSLLKKFKIKPCKIRIRHHHFKLNNITTAKRSVSFCEKVKIFRYNYDTI